MFQGEPHVFPAEAHAATGQLKFRGGSTTVREFSFCMPPQQHGGLKASKMALGHFLKFSGVSTNGGTPTRIVYNGKSH